MDDIWIIIGSIVLVALSSFSKKKKENAKKQAPAVEMQSDDFLEEDSAKAILFEPILGENKIGQEKFEGSYGIYNSIKRDDQIIDALDDEKEVDCENLDLRKAVIFSTILENPYL